MTGWTNLSIEKWQTYMNTKQNMPLPSYIYLTFMLFLNM